MDDLQLAGTITAMLPELLKECLTNSFRNFKAYVTDPTISREDACYRFKRYMEMYWLTVYAGQNEYCDLQEWDYSKWRSEAERVYQQLLNRRSQWGEQKNNESEKNTAITPLLQKATKS